LKSRKIAIASDHAGFYLKEKIVKYLIKEQHEVKDFGCSSEETVDYTDFAHPMAYAVSAGEYELGVSICGTGNGMNITVNKHPGVRSALCWNEEVSRLSRAHNDANVCAMPGWYLSESEAYLIIDKFLATPFEGGRHQKRIDKIPLKIY